MNGLQTRLREKGFKALKPGCDFFRMNRLFERTYDDTIQVEIGHGKTIRGHQFLYVNVFVMHYAIKRRRRELSPYYIAHGSHIGDQKQSSWRLVFDEIDDTIVEQFMSMVDRGIGLAKSKVN